MLPKPAQILMGSEKLPMGQLLYARVLKTSENDFSAHICLPKLFKFGYPGVELKQKNPPDIYQHSSIMTANSICPDCI